MIASQSSARSSFMLSTGCLHWLDTAWSWIEQIFMCQVGSRAPMLPESLRCRNLELSLCLAPLRLNLVTACVAMCLQSAKQHLWLGLRRSYSLPVKDRSGRKWEFVIKSWANGTENRRVYVLEQTGEYLKVT